MEKNGMKDLVSEVLNNISKNIGRSPCLSNRASEIGYAVPLLDGCLRRGVYARTHWQERELHDAKTELIFREGRNQERQVIKDLIEAAIPLIEQQSAHEWKEYNITMHLDAVYVEDGIAYPLEIKSCSPNIFEQIHTIDDLNKKPWLRSYKAQITLYMLAKNIDRGIFVFKNKSTGNLKQLTVDLDYSLGEACLKTAEEINKYVAEGTLPDKIKDIQVCKDCPFKLICCPDVKFGAELKLSDDPLVVKRIDDYYRLKEAFDQYETIYQIIREEAKAQAGESELNMIAGKYRLTGKKDTRGAFRLNIEVI
jgi:CRISPR/Cas system-associated exonuclease Cas4 (RecB family)